MPGLRRAVGAVLLTSLGLVVAGCGSSGGPKFDLATTQKCLEKAGIHAVVDHNTVLNGSQGNLRVDFGYGSPMAFIVFGKNDGEAKDIADHAVAEALRSSGLSENTIRSGVQQTANVFYYSNTGPLTDLARKAIAACLA
jgi:hypothetical protein